MLKELNQHKFSYLLLIVGLTLGVVLFLASWPDRNFQRAVSIGIAAFYTLWGILAHLNEDRITKRIILEYLAVGFLAGLLLILITL